MIPQPVGNRVVVKRDAKKEKTPGGIYLPDDAKDVPCIGTVITTGVAAGNVRRHDRVIFTSYAGTDVKINGEEFIIMSEEDILAVTQL